MIVISKGLVKGFLCVFLCVLLTLGQFVYFMCFLEYFFHLC